MQLELKRDSLEDSYPPPPGFESEFDFSTYFERIARHRGYPEILTAVGLPLYLSIVFNTVALLLHLYINLYFILKTF